VPITIKKLHPLFVAEIGGVDTGAPMNDATFGEIRAALDEYSVLVFHDQSLVDDNQIAFSRAFGPLGMTAKANPATRTAFARQSNLDIETGAVIPSDDRRMIYQKGSYLWHSESSFKLWHSESSFKPVPSLCSLLSARVAPRADGNTEFATMTAAYEALTDDVKQALEGFVAEHSLEYSRKNATSTGAPTAEMKAELSGTWQTRVRENPVNHRKAVYAGAHASHVIGWPREEGRNFIKWLNELATRPHVYSHAWREGDLVIGNNCAVLHRATAYDTCGHIRLMQRTIVHGGVLTTAQPPRYELAAE
jgi:alpha-ketoglutarate-dependent 2,4-dichlorophenoxyacetate dioxygenase